MQQSTTPGLPPEAQQLGEFVAEHEGGSTTNTKLIGSSVLLIVIFVGLFGWVAAAGKLGKDAVLAGCIFGGLCAFFVCGIVLGVLRSRRRVTVFRDGLVSARGSRVEVCRWDDVESVTQSITQQYVNGELVGDYHSYTLRKHDGSTVLVESPLRDVEALGETIRQEVTRRRLPVAAATLQGRGEVEFGPLTLSALALRHRREEVPWAEVADYQVQGGSVFVRRSTDKRPSVIVPVAEIPNFPVLDVLVREALGQAKRGSPGT